VLVFTRRLDEAIVIGDGIEVKVLRIGREGVRLGVTAPLEVPVHRREIYEQIRAANTEAAARAEALAEVASRLAKQKSDDTAN
jgi:carbon storage regulator